MFSSGWHLSHLEKSRIRIRKDTCKISYWLLVEIPEKFKLISPKGLKSTNKMQTLALRQQQQSHQAPDTADNEHWNILW